MTGEFLREVGVLVFVFFGLAALFSDAEKISPLAAIAGSAFGLFSWTFGVLIERERKE
jgi:hypothetical protein